MSNKKKSVEYREALSIRVGKYIQSKGFGVAGRDGIAMEALKESDILNILYKDPDAPRPVIFLIFQWGGTTRRLRIGSLQLKERARWVFNLRGIKTVEVAKKLAAEIASEFNVNITIHLVDEEPWLERFRSDDNCNP